MIRWLAGLYCVFHGHDLYKDQIWLPTKYKNKIIVYCKRCDFFEVGD